eukprot:6657139-Prymnesium_polylepis.2
MRETCQTENGHVAFEGALARAASSAAATSFCETEIALRWSVLGTCRYLTGKVFGAAAWCATAHYGARDIAANSGDGGSLSLRHRSPRWRCVRARARCGARAHESRSRIQNLNNSRIQRAVSIHTHE